MIDTDRQTTETITGPGDKLSKIAKENPYLKAVIFPEGTDRNDRIAYTHLTFKDFDRESNTLAEKMDEAGIKRGMRILYMMKPGIDFLTFIYALFKIGAVPVLLMPGIPKKKMLDCVRESDCQGMVGPLSSHILRIFNPKCFQSVKKKIDSSNSFLPLGMKINAVANINAPTFKPAKCAPNVPALIVYSPGNQGAPNGVIYTYKTLDGLRKNIRTNFNLSEGDTDLSIYPLTSVINPMIAVTSVIPDIDFNSPLSSDPEKMVNIIQNQGVTNILASPSLLEHMGKYCKEHGIILSSLKQISAFGARTLPESLEPMASSVNGNATLFCKYGTVETLSISSVTYNEIASETHKLSEQGFGTCLGKPFDDSNVKLVRINDATISKVSEDIIVSDGDVGEIIVKGDDVSTEYFDNPQEDTYAKIHDKGNSVWHRTGDLAWRDKKGRLWYCGKKNHRVTTKKGPLFTINCEAIFNTHSDVKRSALIGIGTPNEQTPIICIELKKKAGKHQKNRIMTELLTMAKSSEATKSIENVIFVDALPVDAYHQSKIRRSELSKWAENKFLNSQK